MMVSRQRIIEAPHESGDAAAPADVKWSPDGGVDAYTVLRDYRRPGWLGSAEWEQVKGVLDFIVGEITALGTDLGRADFYYEAARVCECELNDDESAVRCLQAAYKANGDHLPTIRMARRVFSRVERWSMVCRFVEAQARLARSDDDRCRALTELGEIYLMKFGRYDEAERCLRRARELAKNSSYLDALLQQVEALSPEQAGTDPGHRLRTYADNVHKNLGKAAFALACLDLSQTRNCDELDEVLSEEAAADQSVPDVAFAALRAVQLKKRWPAYHRMARKQALAIGDRELRSARLHSLAWSGKRDGIPLADVVLCAQGAADCGLKASYLYASLGDALAAAGQKPEAIQAYERAWSTQTEHDWGAYALENGLWLSLADDNMSPVAQSLGGLLLAHQPESELARWFHVRLQIRKKEWSELVSFLGEDRTRQTEAISAAEVSWRIGCIYEFALGRPDDAERAYREAHQRLPTSRIPAISLVGLAARSGNQKHAEGVLEQVITTLGEQDVGGLDACARLSAWWASWLEGTSKADPLEEPSLDLNHDELWPRVDPGYGQPWSNGPAAFVRRLRQRANSSSNSKTRASLHRWVARILVDVGGSSEAIDDIELALSFVPGDIASLRFGARLAESLGRHRVAVDWYVQLSELAPNAVLQGEYLGLAGSLQLERDLDGAVQLWGRSVDAHPGCDLGRRGLNLLLSDVGDDAHRAIDTARSLGRSATVPAEACHYHLIAAELSRIHLESMKDAYAALDEASSMDGGTGLVSLVKLRLGIDFRTTGVLADSLGGLADACTQTGDKAELIGAQGRVYERSGDAMEALARFRRVLDLNPTDPSALDWLLRWLGETGDVDMLSRYVDALLSRNPDQDGRRWLWFEAGRILRTANHIDQATECFEACLRVDKNQPIAIRYMRLLLEEKGAAKDAADLMVVEAALLANRDTAVDILRDAGERYSALGCEVETIDAWLLAYQEQTDDLRLLERLCAKAERLGRWEALATVLECRIMSESDGVEADVLRYCDLLVNRLGRHEDALAVLSRVTKDDPKLPLLQYYADLLLEQEEWDQAAQMYERVFLETQDVALRRALAFRLASLYLTRLDDLTKARGMLWSILEYDSGDVDALMRLADVEAAGGRLHEERLALVRALAATTDANQRGLTRIRLASLDQKEARGDVALNRLKSAAVEMYGSPEVHEALADAYGGGSDLSQQRTALETAIELTIKPADRARLESKLEGTKPPAASQADGGQGSSGAMIVSQALGAPTDPSILRRLLQEADFDRPTHRVQVESLLAGLVESAGHSGPPMSAPLVIEVDNGREGLGNVAVPPELEALRAIRAISEIFPAVYRQGPPDVGAKDESEEDSVLGRVTYASLPEWCIFAEGDGALVSRRLRTRGQPLQQFAWILAQKWAVSGMTFLTRWTAADLKELVTTVGTAIGVLPEKDGGNVSAMVARSVRERIDADSTNTVLIANLSKALETIRRFEDVINGARQQVWRAAVHHTGQVDVAVKLLRHWSATADERWEEQFREDLECLAKWIISGEFATLTGERTPRMEEDSPHE